MNKFIRETFNHAVLDSGCTKTVRGESSLNGYFNTLSANEKVVESDTKFKFGDDNTVKVLKH